MNLDEILDQLAEMPREIYAYLLMAALVGPLVLRVFGFKWLAGLVRPVSLVVLLGGLAARQGGRG